MKKVNVVYCLICNEDNQVLMVYNGDVDAWSMPGGAIEEGELLNKLQ